MERPSFVLDEVAVALRLHPSIAETIVVSKTSRCEGPLVAFVVARRGATLRSPDLQSFLAARLLVHMVPDEFVELSELPKLPNGSVDQRALEAFEQQNMLVETDYVAPTTAIESMLAEIWADVLELEEVGTRDNFFELGGDSIKAMEVCFQVSMQSGIAVDLRRFFDKPTIAELALSISAPGAFNAANRDEV